MIAAGQVWLNREKRTGVYIDDISDTARPCEQDPPKPGEVAIFWMRLGADGWASLIPSWRNTTPEAFEADLVANGGELITREEALTIWPDPSKR